MTRKPYEKPEVGTEWNFGRAWFWEDLSTKEKLNHVAKIERSLKSKTPEGERR